MKLKIKIKEHIAGCMPEIATKGEWIDLRASKNYHYDNYPQADVLKYEIVNGKKVGHRDVTFDYAMIDLGVSMQLPDGFEAVIVPRSSSFKNFGFIQSNHFGVIDSSYCGDNDVWKLPVIFIKPGVIHTFDRVCQFRIQLSQKATFWQKLKWLFCTGIQFEKVVHLNNEERGGFGSTGKN